MQNRFDEFWGLQKKLWQDSFLSKVEPLSTCDSYTSQVPGTSFNFAVPTVDLPGKLNLGESTTFYLAEKCQKLGFVEHLVKSGYKFKGTDVMMILDNKITPVISDLDICTITPETFEDFYKVLSPVFKDFSGNEKYLEICRNSLTGEIKNSLVPDLQSEFFVIYENNEPVSGGALLWSAKENVAYLHDAGTVERFRGRGYQTAIINYRVKKALEQNIDRVYSMVELGSQSWNNLIKCGFSQHQVAYILAKD